MKPRFDTLDTHQQPAYNHPCSIAQDEPMNMFKDDPAFKQMEEQAEEQMEKLLKATVQDYEAYMADRDAAAAEMSAVLKQAKDQGLNVKAFKRLIAERKRDREEIMEEQRTLERYRNLLF